MLTRAILFIMATLALALHSAGCAGTGPSPSEVPLVVEPGSYTRAFDAARHVLRDRGFILERVDARAGVITTQPKTTAGVVTPWDREQQSIQAEFEDFLERQQRIVRITFEPAAPAPTSTPSPEAPPPNLLDAAEPLNMRIQVTLQRINVPGRKLEPEAIEQTSYWYEPAMGERGLQPSYEVSIRRDADGERRLHELIAHRLAEAASLSAAPARP